MMFVYERRSCQSFFVELLSFFSIRPMTDGWYNCDIVDQTIHVLQSLPNMLDAKRKKWNCDCDKNFRPDHESPTIQIKKVQAWTPHPNINPSREMILEVKRLYPTLCENSHCCDSCGGTLSAIEPISKMFGSQCRYETLLITPPPIIHIVDSVSIMRVQHRLIPMLKFCGNRKRELARHFGFMM